VLDGELPADLAGHVFFQSLALGPTDAGLSGDPLVWRVDLDGDTPRITSRLLRTTDYLLARAFADTPYRFESRGMMRMGPLGLQDQPNTALVLMDGNRLFATVDGGRPWELDPATLAPVGPLGHLADYRPMMADPAENRPLCPLMITSAHPPYDAQTGECYGVALSIIPGPGSFFEVLCWSGDGEIKRVPLVMPDGQPVWISQNAHQVCVTRHHLVVLDAAGTIELGKLRPTRTRSRPASPSLPGRTPRSMSSTGTSCGRRAGPRSPGRS
jgi:carotenoid cleavage dioxygenase-like enzyme